MDGDLLVQSRKVCGQGRLEDYPPFEEEHSSLYFGREAVVNSFVERLRISITGLKSPPDNIKQQVETLRVQLARTKMLHDAGKSKK